MAAPSKNFTSIPDSAIDADSPLTETLMTQIRDSLVHLEEWLGDGFTAAKDHDHDGTNSKAVSPNLAQSIMFVEQVSNEFSTTSTSYVDAYVGRFYLQTAQVVNLHMSGWLKTSGGGSDGMLAIIDVDGTAGGVTSEITTGTYGWVDSAAVFTTASLALGWHTVKVQIKKVSHGGAETVFIDGVSIIAF